MENYLSMITKISKFDSLIRKEFIDHLYGDIVREYSTKIVLTTNERGDFIINVYVNGYLIFTLSDTHKGYIKMNYMDTLSSRIIEENVIYVYIRKHNIGSILKNLDN